MESFEDVTPGKHKMTTAYRRPGKGKSIFVQIDGSDANFELTLDLSETIDRVKDKIQEKIQCPRSQQKLVAGIGGKRILLDDGNRTLDSYGVKYGSTIRLVMELAGGGMTISVKKLSGQSSSGDVNISDTISTVLSKLGYDVEGGLLKDLRLEFKGQPLDVRHTLEYYKIPNGSTLDLVPRHSPPKVIEKIENRWATYSRNSLLFAIIMFSSFQDSSKKAKSYTGIDITFLITFGLSFLANAALAVLLPKNWGNFLVYSSSGLLVLVSYLLISSFNELYLMAILSIPILIIVVVLLQLIICREEDEEARANHGIDDNNNQYLKHLCDLSCGIVNCGGFIAMVFGHHMKGKVIALGYSFFVTMALGLYTMAVTTTRTAVHCPNAKLLATLLIVSLAVTLSIAVI